MFPFFVKNYISIGSGLCSLWCASNWSTCEAIWYIYFSPESDPKKQQLSGWVRNNVKSKGQRYISPTLNKLCLHVIHFWQYVFKESKFSINDNQLPIICRSIDASRNELDILFCYDKSFSFMFGRLTLLQCFPFLWKLHFHSGWIIQFKVRKQLKHLWSHLVTLFLKFSHTLSALIQRWTITNPYVLLQCTKS